MVDDQGKRIRFTGASSSAAHRIGTAHLRRQRTYHYAGFETAAWWQDVECQAQSVPLYSNGNDVSWTFEGTVVDAYFPSLYGGVVIGSYDKTRDINKPGRYRFSPYDFMWAEAIGSDGGAGYEDIEFELYPDYAIDSETYRSDFVWNEETRRYGAGERTRWFLTMPESGHRVEVRWTGHRRDGSYYGSTTYDVLDRGEKVAAIEVAGHRGMNGNTHGPALRDAEAIVY